MNIKKLIEKFQKSKHADTPYFVRINYEGAFYYLLNDGSKKPQYRYIVCKEEAARRPFSYYFLPIDTTIKKETLEIIKNTKGIKRFVVFRKKSKKFALVYFGRKIRILQKSAILTKCRALLCRVKIHDYKMFEKELDSMINNPKEWKQKTFNVCELAAYIRRGIKW